MSKVGQKKISEEVRNMKIRKVGTEQKLIPEQGLTIVLKSYSMFPREHNSPVID